MSDLPQFVGTLEEAMKFGALLFPCCPGCNRADYDYQLVQFPRSSACDYDFLACVFCGELIVPLSPEASQEAVERLAAGESVVIQVDVKDGKLQ